MVGVTHCGGALAGLAARRGLRQRRSLPGRPPRSGPPAGRPAQAELVAPPARRGLVGRAARDAARERGRAVRAQRPAEAVDAAHAERDKHIVNVSAVEGQFYRRFKTTRHPHTNMAKAALNMMTRTSAADYQADGIHMNSVDTGWVTDEDPLEHRGEGPPSTASARRSTSSTGRSRRDRRSDHRGLRTSRRARSASGVSSSRISTVRPTLGLVRYHR
jgi:NAD(P)-dependent dehydrogenase (short-subunit alcohol dehydrogenase family)